MKRSVLQPVDVRRAAFFFGLQKMIEMLQPSWVLLALPVFFFEEKESDIFSPHVVRYAHNRAAATTSGEDSREIFRENHGFHHPIFTNKCQQSHIWAGLTCMSELKGFSLSNMTGRLGPLTVHC